MNGNQWYRRALACVLSVLLLASLAGCGGADGGAVAGDGTAGTDRPVPAEGVSKGGGPALPTDVENNGGDFVRVGGKVYFRCYGPDALNKTAVFGIFTNAWNYTGRESQILSYDLASGQVQEVLTQGGYGPLYYGDGGFYLQERTGERDRVVWHSLDGAQSEYLCNGTVEGITSGGLLAVRWDCGPMDSADQFRLYRNTALVCAADLTGDEQFAGLTEDGLFYLLEDTVETEAGEGEPSRLRSLWQLAADGTQIPLGVLPPVEDDFIMSSEIDGFVEGRAVVGLNIGYYAGTAHALQTSTYVSAVPGRADSLTVLEVPEKLYTDGDEPYLTGDGDGSYLTADADGEIAFAPCALDAVEAWWDTGDLVRFDGQDWETLLPAYAATPEDGIGYRKIVQSAQWVDGAAYVCTACVHAAPAENIGWRDAFTLLGMEYLRVTPDGQIEELAFVDHNAVLCGFAWFLEGNEALLWQEAGELDGWSEEVSTVYQIPIAPGAVWDGGKETILSHASRASLTELDEASYYGYPIPDTGTDELLYLRLNRDGEAVFLTETSPDALLSIQIGMPESELDGAVEALNLQRRVSDEDTPWYWAKLTALQDGVDVRVERTPDDGGNDPVYMTLMEGVFVPGQLLLHQRLDAGAYIAVRTSLPWYPEMRVSAGKDGAWGAYVFGEDNYLHLENEDGSIPEKILAGYSLPDLSEYGAVPDTLVHGGDWFLYDDDHKTDLARVSFAPLDEEAQLSSARYLSYDSLGMTVMRSDEEDSLPALTAQWGNLYAYPYGLPDLLELYSGDGSSAGDYRADIYRTDGLELLRLTQVNNGDGLLSQILSQAYPGGENRTAFTLVRWRGMGQPGARIRNTTCPAVIVNEAPDGSSIWMQEAEQVDEWEDGTPVYLPIPGAPCLPYVYSVEAAVPEDPWEAGVYMVSVDRDGVVYEIADVA